MHWLICIIWGVSTLGFIANISADAKWLIGTLAVFFAALIGAVWASKTSYDNTGKKVDVQSESIKTEREKLSGEHKTLVGEHALIVEKINNISNTTKLLEEEAIGAAAIRQILPKKDFDLTETFAHMSVVMEENINLRTEIKNHQQRIQQLHDENIQLKTYLKSQQADRDYEPEL